MSEAAPTALPVQPVPSSRSRRYRLNPLEALERGFFLFQSTFAREGWRYYTASAPLVLCFIPMWVIDGQIRISNSALLLEATLLGAAYVLRLWMVASYMQSVRERAFGVTTTKPAGATARMAALGRLLTWKIALSLVALSALPTIAGISWFYGASQFASLKAGEDAAERNTIGGCLSLSGRWFGAGLLLFLMLIPLWIAVWLNALILATILPQLLHSIFGVNTLLSTAMGMFALLQSSAFWLSLFAGAWLALDPIVKCTFVVVYQHLRSREEGDDLRGLLANLPREQKKKSEMMGSTRAGRGVGIGAVTAMTVILLGVFQASTARASQVAPLGSRTEIQSDSANQARIQKLRQALEEESQRSIYRWHDSEHPSTPTWFDKLLEAIGHAFQRVWNWFWNLLQKLWPRGLSLSFGNGKGGWRLKDFRLWVALVLILTIAAGGMLIWLRRRREAPQLSIPVEVAPEFDLNVAASERSEDEWFALANRLEGEGELLPALRAAYLGLLAGLAQREWLTIRRDRTNREYLDEFTRRWRRRPQAAVEVRAEMPDKLRGSLRQFDRAWYGFYALTPAAVTAYCHDQREFLSHV